MLRGIGKQKFGAILNAVSYYGVGLPLGAVLLFVARIGVIGTDPWVCSSACPQIPHGWMWLPPAPPMAHCDPPRLALPSYLAGDWAHWGGLGWPLQLLRAFNCTGKKQPLPGLPGSPAAGTHGCPIPVSRLTLVTSPFLTRYPEMPSQLGLLWL